MKMMYAYKSRHIYELRHVHMYMYTGIHNFTHVDWSQETPPGGFSIYYVPWSRSDTLEVPVITYTCMSHEPHKNLYIYTKCCVVIQEMFRFHEPLFNPYPQYALLHRLLLQHGSFFMYFELLFFAWIVAASRFIFWCVE